jgi:two-component system sensor histidine kinase KdpD
MAAILQFDERSHRERFRLSQPADEVPVFGDRKLMQRALLQLLDNALKYSVPESPIEIKVAVTERDVIAEIRNQGPAIAPAEQDRIFDRFYRASETRFGAPGTGLGLSIVRKIADAHRGRVWVESGEHDTTAFFFALPK